MRLDVILSVQVIPEDDDSRLSMGTSGSLALLNGQKVWLIYLFFLVKVVVMVYMAVSWQIIA